ncbi:hypothetical protein ACQRIT_002937 [Beauveria bassiana]
MKYFTILAIPSILAAANPSFPRQEAQSAANATQLLALRAEFCIDADKPECQEAIGKCQDEAKIIEDCIKDEHPACIKDENSPCSKAISQCVLHFGQEQDADQAVKHCIVEKMISGSATNGNQTSQPTETEAGNEQALPSSSASPQQVVACEKASAEYLEIMLKKNCNEISDVGESGGAAPESESPVCKTAVATFEQIWTANDCDATIGANKEG